MTRKKIRTMVNERGRGERDSGRKPVPAGLGFIIFLMILAPSILWGGRAHSADEVQVRTWSEPLTEMELVWIEGGCFSMGSPPDENGRNPDEGPVHEVCVEGFWMGRHEVTRGQFRKFAEAKDHETDAEKEGFSWIYTGKWERRPGYNWNNAGFEQDDDHPVVNVSWNDAKAMARWLSRESDGRFRLPTEAEWEYACRAGSRSSRFWGKDPVRACRYANVADFRAREKFPAWEIHRCNDGFVFTAPVGSFHPNGFGLYDMLGNVWEWCEDTYDWEAYGKRAASSRNVLSRTGRSGRVIRGGSWYSRPEFARCASRDNLNSTTKRGYDLGFRLVRIP